MSLKIDEMEEKVILEKLLGSNGGAGDPNLLSEAVNPAMLDQLDRMNRTAVNRSYRAIPGTSFSGKCKRALKRLLRSIMFWYVEPCMMQQTTYNSANNAFSAQVNLELNALKCEAISLRNQMEELAIKNQNLQQELTQQARELKKDQEELELMNQEFLEQLAAGSSVDLESRKDRKVSCQSYSQSGEDAILRFIFRSMNRDLSQLTYLDLGANHAKFLSNTYSFYREGASGVLVEANPSLIEELKTVRPRDTVVNRCISNQADTTLTFYVMNGDGLSTMDYEAAKSFMKENPAIQIEQTVSVPSITIPELIAAYFPDRAPDLVNIDIEGMELDVLRMMNFDTFRPFAIICEMIEYKTKLGIPKKNTEILQYLRKKGYEEYAFTGINSIFIDQTALGGAAK